MQNSGFSCIIISIFTRAKLCFAYLLELCEEYEEGTRNCNPWRGRRGDVCRSDGGGIGQAGSVAGKERKGRCNVTNDCTAEEVLKNTPRNGRFLYSAMYGFPPERTKAFFERHGCPLKTERGNRVFPVSDKSASIIAALKDAIRGVPVFHARAERIVTENGRVVGVVCGGREIRAKCVILATGGKSYPATGSTGDGYAMAAALGHTIVPPAGSLVPMVEDGDWCAKMRGLSLRNVGVRLYAENQKLVHEEFGELLFTHFGLSGPTILSLSAHMEPNKKYTVTIDLKPALDEKKLEERILRDFAAYQNRNFENALFDLYPKTMVPVMVARSGIAPQTKVHSITKQQRRALLALTKRFPVAISGLRPVEEAIITAGGVQVSQVQPKTMESKLVKGLYFAGEILDVNAYTGGFNLQIAWATAYAAARASCEATDMDEV